MTTRDEYAHIATALQSSLVQAMEAESRAQDAGDEGLSLVIAEHAMKLRATLDALQEKAGRR